MKEFLIIAGKFVGAILLFMALVMGLLWLSQPAKDDTDSPTARSGLTLRTDHLTGCQYLIGGAGITPRMGADGKQLCEKKP